MRRVTPEERAAQKKLINELYEKHYGTGKPGDPAKFDVTPAGPQGNMFNEQAQAPKGAIKSQIPLNQQFGGTMFDDSNTSQTLDLFDCKDSQDDKR